MIAKYAFEDQFTPEAFEILKGVQNENIELMKQNAELIATVQALTAKVEWLFKLTSQPIPYAYTRQAEDEERENDTDNA